jgi:hypothetical protein
MHRLTESNTKAWEKLDDSYFRKDDRVLSEERKALLQSMMIEAYHELYGDDEESCGRIM